MLLHIDANTLLQMMEKHRIFGNRSLVITEWHDTKRLWPDGYLVNGYWNEQNRKLYLDNGNRDNRNPSNGPREKFLHVCPAI